MAASFTPAPILRGAVPTAAPSIGSPSYTVQTNQAVIIRRIDPTNTTGSTITWRVWAVPSGSGAITDAMLVIADEPVYASSVGASSEDRVLVLATGDMIFWQASATGLNGYISGGVEVLA